jgi:protein TonB
MMRSRLIRTGLSAAVLGVVLSCAGWGQETKTEAPQVYRIGRGVTAPRFLHRADPQYSPEARKKKIQGIVLLSLIVNKDGRTEEIKVIRGLGHGLDEKAVECARQWEFAPAEKDGVPVAVFVNVEVNFHLY